MAYTTPQAVEALNEYMGCDETSKEYIKDTKDRGFVLTLQNGEKIVIFVYPLVHKQDNTKNYFDTRDSGAYERGVAWKYALEHGLKYYCFGLNSSVDKYENYIFSLECGEDEIEKISGTKNGQRNGPGNQIIIPNNYVPKCSFDRIINRLGIHIAVIHKAKIYDYISIYDNRPYLKAFAEIEIDDPEERNKRNFRAWMETQVKPEGDSDAGNPYTENTIDQYVSNISSTPLPSHEDHSIFFTDAIAEVKDCIVILDTSEKKNNTQRSAVKKYLKYLMAQQEVNTPLIYNTDLETEYERNRIVFGAPGTGKSFNLKRDCEKILSDTTGSYERVTFYPDYTYSQFVGTYKPVSDGATIRYEFVPGPFMRVYVEAMKSARSLVPQPYILIIEEINRAKVAAVFGDVFQLLDRDDDGVSEYEIQTSEDIRKYLATELKCDIAMCKKIKIPNNMFIWSTMNSADQGVFPMDTAFKRRWNFEYLGINENQDKIKGRVVVGKTATQEIEWNVLRRAINEKLVREYKVNEDKLMGPFFIAKRVLKTVSEDDDTIMDAERFKDVFKSKVIMYLYEDASKQHKHKLFSGCKDTTKYSAVCDSFDEIGIQIFGEDFEEVYYNPQKG